MLKFKSCTFFEYDLLSDDEQLSVTTREFWQGLESLTHVPIENDKTKSFGCGFDVTYPHLEKNPMLYISGDFVVLKCVIEERKIKKKILLTRLERAKNKYISKNGADSLTDEITDALRYEIEKDLIKNALEDTDIIWVMLSSKDKWLSIGATSPKKLDIVLNLLNEASGSHLSFKSIENNTDYISDVFTSWITQDEAHDDFSVGYDCVLLDIDKSKANYSNQELTSSSEISKNIECGKKIFKVRLNIKSGEEFCFDYFCSAVINEKLAFSGIKWAYEIDDQLDSDDLTAIIDCENQLIYSALDVLFKTVLKLRGV